MNSFLLKCLIIFRANLKTSQEIGILVVVIMTQHQLTLAKTEPS